MVKEGYAYGLPLLLISGALFGLHIFIPAVIFLIAALFVLNFFRNPDRNIPADPGALVSPADGRVVQITEEEFEGQRMQRLSIFMSPLDVHVNRSPIAGRCGKCVTRRELFEWLRGRKRPWRMSRILLPL